MNMDENKYDDDVYNKIDSLYLKHDVLEKNSYILKEDLHKIQTFSDVLNSYINIKEKQKYNTEKILYTLNIQDSEIKNIKKIMSKNVETQTEDLPLIHS